MHFDVCLLNRYDDGRNSLAWHSDREEIDPAQDAPRLSPIASISLGAERLFGFLPKWDSGLAKRVKHDAAALASSVGSLREKLLHSLQSTGFEPIRLGHGSLCVMENVSQLIYKHALIPEPMVTGLRVNLTFRQKSAVEPAVRPLPRALAQPAQDAGHEGLTTQAGAQPVVFVGSVAQAKDDPSRANGWKQTLLHMFESPFVDDEPEMAAAKYQSWLLSQPAFCRWVQRELAGRTLSGNSARDAMHARVLAHIAAMPPGLRPLWHKHSLVATNSTRSRI